MAINDELSAYLVLIDQLDGFDPQPDHVLRKVLISDQYKDFMAGCMGVEIASFYLSYDSEAREFLGSGYLTVAFC